MSGERRNEKRYTTSIIFSYEIRECPTTDPENLQVMGTAEIKDITFSGAKISSLQHLRKDTLLAIDMIPLSDDAHVVITGKVVWSKEMGMNTYNCGVQFLEFMKDSQKLLKKYLTVLREKVNDPSNLDLPPEKLENF